MDQEVAQVRDGDQILPEVASGLAIQMITEQASLMSTLGLVPIEPGHVMSREKYRKFVESQQRQK